MGCLPVDKPTLLGLLDSVLDHHVDHGANPGSHEDNDGRALEDVFGFVVHEIMGFAFKPVRMRTGSDIDYTAKRREKSGSLLGEPAPTEYVTTILCFWV